mmetsp:Transcript_167195/g.537041  ORF Transcript_167195/g.537041 Transcript_167195/m.537041 type:complete len:584 (-) Transcript_167195:26-1777(-)
MSWSPLGFLLCLSSLLLERPPLMVLAQPRLPTEGPTLRRDVGSTTMEERRRLVYSLSENDRVVSPEEHQSSYGFVVSIQRRGRHVCGGSLLSADWVLTAAHCLPTARRALVDYTVTGNATDIRSAGVGSWTSRIDVAAAHAAFDVATLRNDVALLRLATSAPSAPSAGASLATLPAQGARFDPPAHALIMGWGSTDAECTTYSGVLREGSADIVGPSLCSLEDPFYNDSATICASHVEPRQNNSGAGCGDSGGPVLLGHETGSTLVGIVSYTFLKRDTFTRVSSYMDWIQRTTSQPHQLSVLKPPLCHNACCDISEFVSPGGEMCQDWAGLDCASAGSYGYSHIEIAWLLGNCSATCKLCTDCEPSNAACCDNLAFLDATGDACKLWQTFDCNSAASALGYTLEQQDDLLRNCPLSCAACSTGSDCLDSVTFVDEKGFSCASWSGFDCSSAAAAFGYAPRGEAELLRQCRRSCGRCPLRSIGMSIHSPERAPSQQVGGAGPEARGSAQDANEVEASTLSGVLVVTHAAEPADVGVAGTSGPDGSDEDDEEEILLSAAAGRGGAVSCCSFWRLVLRLAPLLLLC